jgi:uncharacterized protein (DUF924 family)
MTTVNEVVDFWLDEVGPERWYDADEALDQEVRRRFEQLWWNTLNGANGLWLTYATGTLAYLILMDQMPRNMFRGNRAIIWIRSACPRGGESGVAQWLGFED